MLGTNGVHGKPIAQNGAVNDAGAIDEHGRDQSTRGNTSDPNAPLAAGLEHHKAQTGETSPTHAFEVKQRAEFIRHEKGQVPMTVEAYAVLTGIQVDAAEAQRLDKKVKEVAEKLGIEHTVGFAVELDYMKIFQYPVLGTFDPSNRPTQPILVGVGIKAKTIDDIELLYKYWNRGAPMPERLHPWLKDFLSLDETQRIEAVLVHEKHEVDALPWAKRPHHMAVEMSATTHYDVSPVVRRHLEMYARINKQIFGDA